MHNLQDRCCQYSHERHCALPFSGKGKISSRLEVQILPGNIVYDAGWHAQAGIVDHPTFLLIFDYLSTWLLLCTLMSILNLPASAPDNIDINMHMRQIAFTF